eukprot:TRINITY_DN2640_c1_g2_i1.p1 TRINITY_DN2640_c1_g2~~TRINITY_DN2640_c1_g2_i1.p1  ORF type:complete len:566 (-),score=95.02 TRINITY_DN2640_c1_g2_i1:36-1733(-)
MASTVPVMTHPPTVIDWTSVWQGDLSSVQCFVAAGLEVATIEGRGRGVRTTRAVPAGTLLLAERALATATEASLPAFLVGLQSSLDELRRRQLELMCDGTPPRQLADTVELRSWPGDVLRHAAFEPIELARMRRIVDLNAYRCSPSRSEYEFTVDDGRSTPAGVSERNEVFGLFPLGSLVNHACAPNLSKVLLGEWVFLRAARDLQSGEELTQFYCDIRMPMEMRRKELQELFDFHCDCRRCAFEADLVAAAGEELLKPWRGLYSSQVPAVPRRGPFQTSRLESLVALAEQACGAGIAALHRSRRQAVGSSAAARALREDNDEEERQWGLWPLVPAFSQLADRLCIDGRVEESAVVWRRVARMAAAVVPASNIHLRILGEMLLCLAESRSSNGGDEAVSAALTESLSATSVGYGGGVSVWRELFGFRMPSSVLKLVPETDLREVDNGLQDIQPVAVGAMAVPEIEGVWTVPVRDTTTGLLRATFTAQSPVFERLGDLILEVSEKSLMLTVLADSSIGRAEIRAIWQWPFQGVDLESVALAQPKFSTRRRQLTVSVVERAHRSSAS